MMQLASFIGVMVLLILGGGGYWWSRKNLPIPNIMLAPILAGTAVTGLFLGAWVAYFWGDGDGERAVFCSAVEVFAAPLLVGSIMVLRRQRVGVYLLRFGSILFICEPITLLSLWELEDDPEYTNYLLRRGY